MPEGDARRLNRLAELPLATARDLASLSDLGSTLVYHRLGHLRQRGLADSAPLGWSGSRSMRRFLTDSAMALPGRLGATWRQEFSRRRLLERLPSVEWFYQVVSQIEDFGPFEALHWMDWVSPDAVARRQYGWIALFWSGSFQSEDWTASRLGRLARDHRACRMVAESGGPGWKQPCLRPRLGIPPWRSSGGGWKTRFISPWQDGILLPIPARGAAG